MARFRRGRHRVEPAHQDSLTNDSLSDDPTQPLDLTQSTPVDSPLVQQFTIAKRSEAATVAEVIGPLAIPQITVGPPSPCTEPEPIGAQYRSFPFRPDVVIDGWSTDSITVRGVSQRGHLHRYNGAPRQDDFAIHHASGGRVVILVADGISGARQSHIGASAAIKQAARWLQEHLNDDPAQTDWLTLFKNVAWELTEQAQSLLQLAEPDPLRAEQEMATTLVCGIIEPLDPGRSRAYVVGVGDSSAWLLSRGAFRHLLGGKPLQDSAITTSSVAGLPRLPAELTPVVVEFTDRDVLLIGTDGIGDPLGTGQGGVGNLLRAVLSTSSPPSLIEFAHAVDFSREMFDDDRTLVAVWSKRPPPAVPSPQRPGADRRVDGACG
ncbi:MULTISPECIES: PP2C family serine/threonine-protein phosphatase [Mycobacterium]|uniref:PP2C family protein-serine/threonine phosphatase n=1 Tax=Mycobacterium TaxID=1763 RepID=UPI0009ECA374|nr:MULTISPECIES: protein phosphatase 2C domain-containing protein [Mycobacterium]MDP7707131.1 protein phosphatase 2C domain-containing protein [Mycobacterium sp. TY815]